MADDDGLVLALIREIISPLSWTIYTASNGTEALQLIERIVPNLVISDIHMPGLGGLDLVQRMRDGPRLSHIPVILVSDPLMEPEALAAGCDAFVSKHALVDTLLQIALNLVLPEGGK